ncbi:MAG: Phosphotransferase enzyme family [Arthrobacter sp.]|nr:Phosphotransferase enzyme family [Arthrobacter sp.]
MTWSSPIPPSATDEAGTTWQILRAWPYRMPGDYTLEVRAAGRPGVRGAQLRHGQFSLIPPDDPRLPALRAEAEQGVIVRYMPYKRAVVRAQGRYIKIFRPGSAAVPAERCAQMDILLDAGTFITPRILRRSSQDVIVFSAIPGPTLNELGEDASPGDEPFIRAWEKWSRAWVMQLNGPHGPAQQGVLDSLPLRSADVQAEDVWRRLNRWLRHNEDVPGLSSPRNIMLARAEQVTANLLRTPPDPLVWAHGDLHDKQIIATAGPAPLGLLDFDGTSRAEAALDLANLDVHLELHLRQGRLTPSRYRAAHMQVLAAAEELHVSPGRFRAYSDALWFRLASSPLPGRLSLALAVLADRAERHQASSSATATRMA